MQQIDIQQLTFAYQKGRPLFQRLNLKLPIGAFSLLTGPTGCGKTTLLKLIAGLYPKYAGHVSGKINLHGLKSAMMFQDAGEQFTMPTPRQEIIFALENLQVKRPLYEQRLKRAVTFTQISRLLDQKINTLSGGEQQRVALAVLIAMNVDLFLLDEPFSSVDTQSRQFLIKKLALLRDQGKTIILSDHLLTGYQQACDAVFTFNRQKVDRLSSIKMKAYLKPKKQKKLHFQLPNHTDKILFQLKKTDLDQAGRLLLKQNQLTIFQGKNVLITGPNGIGKSTLFKALTKMLPYKGSLKFHQQEISHLRRRPYLAKVAQAFQRADDQFLEITVHEELKLSLKQRSPYFANQRLKRVLRELNLIQLLDHVVYTLSGGQKKKLQLLLMLLTQKQALLLDEPFAGLDQSSVQQVLQLLGDCQKHVHQTYLIISHQYLDQLAQLCPYHLVFHQQHLTYVRG